MRTKTPYVMRVYCIHVQLYKYLKENLGVVIIYNWLVIFI